MSYDRPQQPRDYGGWRRRRGIGLFGLGAAGTAGVLAALLALIITAAADPVALLYVAPPVLAGGGLALARVNGEPLALAALRRARWRYAASRDYTGYRADVVAEHSPAFPLPGVLAPLALLDAEDGYGGRYGIVLDRRTAMMTATLRVIPASPWLADRADADGWVANWGGWLSSLGYLPAVRWVTVTVDTAPEPGTALADEVAAALDPAAPPPARQIMGQLAAAAPAAAADVDTRVTVTFDRPPPRRAPRGDRRRRRGRADAARPGISPGHLRGYRAGPGQRRRDRRHRPHRVRPRQPRRGEPAARPAGRGPARRRPGLGGGRAGRRRGSPDCYRHDSGTSITWCWREAPRQNVTSDVLARPVAPVPCKRVPCSTGRSRPQGDPGPAIEVNAAQFREAYRHRTGRDETARDSADQARAAGRRRGTRRARVGLISVYVTVTVARDADLPRAAAETGSRRVLPDRRPHAFSQAAGWAATPPAASARPVARRMPH